MSACRNEDGSSKCSLKWTPTSSEKFEAVEEKMYAGLKHVHETKFVEIFDKHLIRCVKIGDFDDHEQLPLVLIHGFAAGSAFWVLNMDALSSDRNVYCVDLLGFARSSRPTFPADAELVDEMFVKCIEHWRRQMRLEKFVLCGHSFGGYISSLYTLHHSDKVLHLILDDPWGFPTVPPPGEGPFGKAPKWKKAVFNILTSFNPLSALRVVGPLGPSLITKLRPDIVAKYSGMFEGEEENAIADYMFHCNVQKPSGETAFTTVSETMIYAKNPIVNRLPERTNFPITIITGSDSWINSISQFEELLQDELSGNIENMRLIVIDDAGHHVHADQPDEFNEHVNSICASVQKSYNEKSKLMGLETTI